MTVFKTKTRENFVLAVLCLVFVALLGTGVHDSMHAQALPPQPLQPPGTVAYTTISTTGTTNLTMLPAASGLRYNITEISCVNTSTTPTAMQIYNSSAVAYVMPCPINAGAPAAWNFAQPLTMTSQNSTVGVASTNAATTVYLSFKYYKSR